MQSRIQRQYQILTEILNSHKPWAAIDVRVSPYQPLYETIGQRFARIGPISYITYCVIVQICMLRTCIFYRNNCPFSYVYFSLFFARSLFHIVKSSYILCQVKLEYTKEKPACVNRRRTVNTMAKRKRAKDKQESTKCIVHITLMIDQDELNKNRDVLMCCRMVDSSSSPSGTSLVKQ